MRISLKRGFILSFALLSVLPLSSDGAPGTEEHDLSSGLHTKQKKDHRWGRDPFYRERRKGTPEIQNEVQIEVEAEQEPEFDFFLSGIIFREGDGVAIINDQIVRRGDMIGDGIIVSHIFSSKVFLQHGKRTLVLRVQPFGPN